MISKIKSQERIRNAGCQATQHQDSTVLPPWPSSSSPSCSASSSTAPAPPRSHQPSSLSPQQLVQAGDHQYLQAVWWPPCDHQYLPSFDHQYLQAGGRPPLHQQSPLCTSASCARVIIIKVLSNVNSCHCFKNSDTHIWKINFQVIFILIICAHSGKLIWPAYIPFDFAKDDPQRSSNWPLDAQFFPKSTPIHYHHQAR